MTMQSKIRRLALCCAPAALLVASTALAECGSYYCSNARILSLYTTISGDVYVQVDGAMSNLNCTRVGGVYMTLQASAPRFKEMYAAMLAYQLADRAMTFRVDDASNGCTIAYITTP